MSDYLKGRTSFDKNRYERNDSIGKKLGVSFLNFMIDKKQHKKILPIVENKKCGDIKLLDTITGNITYYEIEVRSKKDFDNNFFGYYNTVDIPLKKFEQIENGYYLAFDESEEFNDSLPKRLYGLDISIIKNHSPKYKETKFNPGKKELFYQIPKNLIKRYKLDNLKGKYIEYTI